jgi:hypothetical protein
LQASLAFINKHGLAAFAAKYAAELLAKKAALALLDPKAQTKRDKCKLRKQAERDRAKDPAKQKAWDEKQDAKKKEAARTKECAI